MESSQNLRRGLRALAVELEELRSAADRIGVVRLDVSLKEACRVIEFLEERVVSRARSEDRFFYPAVGRALGSAEATRPMTRDHFEVAMLTRELKRATEEGDAVTMRRLLYGLYHLIRLHLAKEEEIYLPALEDHVAPEQVHVVANQLLWPGD